MASSDSNVATPPAARTVGGRGVAESASSRVGVSAGSIAPPLGTVGGRGVVNAVSAASRVGVSDSSVALPLGTVGGACGVSDTVVGTG